MDIESTTEETPQAETTPEVAPEPTPDPKPKKPRAPKAPKHDDPYGPDQIEDYQEFVRKVHEDAEDGRRVHPLNSGDIPRVGEDG